MLEREGNIPFGLSPSTRLRTGLSKHESELLESLSAFFSVIALLFFPFCLFIALWPGRQPPLGKDIDGAIDGNAHDVFFLIDPTVTF